MPSRSDAAFLLPRTAWTWSKRSLRWRREKEPTLCTVARHRRGQVLVAKLDRLPHDVHLIAGLMA